MGQIVAALAGLNCNENCSGGVKKIYVANTDDIDSVTKDGTGAITSITMVAGKKFYEAVFKPRSKEYTENTTYDPGTCSTVVTQTLEGSVACCTAEGRIWLKNALLQNCCGIAVIHEETAGCVMAWGFESELGAYIVTSDKKTGKQLADANERILKFECKTTVAGLATEFTGTVPTTS